MKITRDNIFILEHEIISEICAWESTSGTDAEKMLFYIKGINDMAEAVVKRMKDLEKV